MEENTMKKFAGKIKDKVILKYMEVVSLIRSNQAEGFVDTASASVRA